jgi:hypothetical protein
MWEIIAQCWSQKRELRPSMTVICKRLRQNRNTEKLQESMSHLPNMQASYSTAIYLGQLEPRKGKHRLLIMDTVENIATLVNDIKVYRVRPHEPESLAVFT